MKIFLRDFCIFKGLFFKKFVMKTFILLLSLVLTTSISPGQCPTTEIFLETQDDIDNFATNYPNCSTPTQTIWVGNENSDITNLNGLASITSAYELEIHDTLINDFSGLHNLQAVSHLSLWFNPNIQNLNGLTSLQSVGLLDIFVNANMTDLSGMDSIDTIENIIIFRNQSLTDISDLSFLETINSLTITDNNLNSLNGLENLHTVIQDLAISHEDVVNFNELTSLQTIGRSLHITNNLEINDVTALNNIGGLEELYVVNCPILSNFSGLENIQNVSGRLRISFNSELTDLSVFSNLNSVGDLDIFANDNLESLSGLENLQEVSNRLFIGSNMSLTSIEAINDLSTSQINQVVVVNNANLAACNNLFMCTVINDPSLQLSIFNNSIGCSSILEIEASCILSVSDLVLNDAIVIYPNPVSEILQINISEGLMLKKITVFSILGQQLRISTDQTVNLSSLSQRAYFVEITTDQGSIIKKVIKG